VRTGLFYFDHTLWDVLPAVYEHMAAALALMESPAIVLAVLLANSAEHGQGTVTIDEVPITIRISMGSFQAM